MFDLYEDPYAEIDSYDNQCGYHAFLQGIAFDNSRSAAWREGWEFGYLENVK